MKKLVTILLAIALVLSCASGVMAEEAELTVGNSTMLSGSFFTDLWGNNTCDIDVRRMLFDYSVSAWVTDLQYTRNHAVTRSVASEKAENGNRVYTIELRDGLMYSDGSPITAADYVFTMLLLASPELKALNATGTAYSYVDGYEAYYSGESKEFAGVKLTDENTFTVEVKAADELYFYEMAYLDILPYPISVLAPGCEVADDGNGAYMKGEFTAELLYQTIFGKNGYMSHPSVVTGPYTLVKYDEETHEAEFEMNPHYAGNYNGKKPTIKTVKLVYVSPDEEAEAVISGKVDIMNKCVSESEIEEAKAAGLKTKEYNRRGYASITMACEREIPSSEKVRQALYYALDKDALVNGTVGKYGEAVYSYYGLGQWMVMATEGKLVAENLSSADQRKWNSVTLKNLNHYDYNLDVAKSLLEEDGWKLNAEGGEYESGIRYKKTENGLEELTLKWAKSEESTIAGKLEEIYALALKEIGVNLEITTMPFVEVLAKYYDVGNREYDMYYLATNFDEVFNPILTFSTNEELMGVTNMTGYRDEKLESLAREMVMISKEDIATYLVNWQKFEEYYNEVLPTLPLYSDEYVDIINDRVTSYYVESAEGWPEAILSVIFK